MMSLESYQPIDPISIKDRFLSKKEFLSEEYINNIIETEHWVEHGSHLEYFLMDMKEEDDFPEQIRELDDKETIHSPVFKEYLTNWLRLRYDYAINLIQTELERKGFPLEVNRTLFLSKDDLQKVLDGENLDLGRYWGLYDTDAYQADEEKIKGLIEVNVTATVSQSDIDWNETLKSRMDYSNGDQEEEIYIHEKAQPVFNCVSHELDKQDVILQNKEVQRAVQAHLCDWLTDTPLEEINQGYCADFADIFCRSIHGKKLEEIGLNPDVRGCYELEDLKREGLDKVSPSWSNWKQIELLAKKNIFNHSFIYCDNKYYDAECVTGVDSAFDLPIFERAASEYKALIAAEREKEVSELSY